jgi:hypothetical protein
VEKSAAYRSCLRRRQSLFNGDTPLSGARRRLELAQQTGDQCIVLLMESLRRCLGEKVFPRKELSEATRIGERLNQLGLPEDGVIHDWLAFDFEQDFHLDHWLAGMAIDLAGRRQLVAESDRIIDLFEYDWDWWNERIESSLKSMKSPETLGAICRRYASLDWPARLFLMGAVEGLRFPGLHLPIAELVRHETDDGLRARLGCALAGHGSKGAMETALDIFREDPERLHIVEMSYAFRTILGEDDEELRGWRNRLVSHRERTRQSLRSLSAGRPAEATSGSKVGRNDPCPCGSGKKHKKCCLRLRN